MHLHPLNFTEAETNLLHAQYQALLKHLEKGRGLLQEDLPDIRNTMQNILHGQEGLQDFWKQVREHPYEHYQLHLVHADKDLLNLPWQLAVDDVQYPFVRISKGLPSAKSLASYKPRPGPLKILIMISSPEDADVSNRLSYEQEEEAILKALAPLWESGQVHVDFTQDGSLQSLQEQLALQHYHIFHFSGHGTYKDDTGYLLLEDEKNLDGKYVTAQQLAVALQRKPAHKPALVILASCKTAQGSMEAGFRGVADELMKIGVPAVISMAFSIIDHYATVFSAYLYAHLAKQEPLLQAYTESLISLRQEEEKHMDKSGGYFLTQWLIPQLYCSKMVENIVNWDSTAEVMTTSRAAARVINENQFLFLKHAKEYQFIGRRRDSARFFSRLLKHQGVFIRGQGGVGKTSMAEHLVRRMLMHNSSYHYFDFSEAGLGIPAMITKLQEYLRKEHRQYAINHELDKRQKAVEKLDFLLQEVVKKCTPLFVFDNMETCQEETGGAIKPAYKDWLEYIQHNLINEFPVIFTGRYLIEELNDIYDYSLNQVFFVDFYRKCLQLSIKNIQYSYLELNFGKTAQLLFDTLGGNYRALEFFDEIYKNAPERIVKLLGELQAEKIASKIISAEVQERLEAYSKKLVFGELLQLLNEEEIIVLQLLAQFRKPVLTLALEMQREHSFETALLRLHNLTMIEVHENNDTGLIYYYVTPLVKNWLEGNGLHYQEFSHERAGKYYEHTSNHIEKNDQDLEEAFWHYSISVNKDSLNRVGVILATHYYEQSLFEQAFQCAVKVEKLLEDETDANILNISGLIYSLRGDYTTSLEYFTSSLKADETFGNEAGSGNVLSNIGTVYLETGYPEKALEYYKKSFRLNRAGNNREAMGTALHNIGHVYSHLGDLKKGLTYFNKSLAIAREMNSIPSVCVTLDTIGHLYKTLGDHDTALRYLAESLELAELLGKKEIKASTLNGIGQIHEERGEYESALENFYEALALYRQIGKRAGEASMLINISAIYRRGGYFEEAVQHMENALRIAREIGDRPTEATALNNIGGIYLNTGNYDKALEYFNESLHMAKLTLDKAVEASIYNNLSRIYKDRGDHIKAKEYLEHSLIICEGIGDKSTEAIILNNLGQLYVLLNEDDKAVEYFNKGLMIREATGNKAGEASILISIGRVYNKKGDAENALACFAKSLTIRESLSDIRGIANVFHNVAGVYFDQGDYQQYLHYEARAYEIYTQVKDQEGMYHVGILLGRFYCTMDDPELLAKGLSMLKQSCEIGAQTGYANVHEVAELIEQFSGKA